MTTPTLTTENSAVELNKFIEGIPSYPDPAGYYGRGVVVCAGGPRYFTCAWVCISMLRRMGCRLPVQLWYMGRDEVNSYMRSLISFKLDVECVDAFAVREKHPHRLMNGLGVKPFAIKHCPFKEVLLLDADNVPVVDPTFLFDTPQFKDTGAICWPDALPMCHYPKISEVCGTHFAPHAQSHETGQLVIDKEKCWKALNIAVWLNEHPDFFDDYMVGDKESFHVAFNKLKQPFSMPSTKAKPLRFTGCQHDFDGRRIFQHRNSDKWSLSLDNRYDEDFLFQNECIYYLVQLHDLWDGLTFEH